MIENYKKENIPHKLSIILVLLLPTSIVLSSVAMNLIVVTLSFIYLFIVLKNQRFNLNDHFLKIILLFLIFIYIALFFSIDFNNSLSRTIGFVRFIVLAYAIKYFITYSNYRYFKLFSLFWSFFFLFISLDLIFEFFVGFNLIGISNNFPGRLSGFLGDELKIGYFYFGFGLFISAIINEYYGKKYFLISIIIFLIISLLIGERANFLKFFFATLFFIILCKIITNKTKLILSFLLTVFPLVLILFNEDINNRFNNQFAKYIKDNGIKSYYYNSQYGAHFDAGIKIIQNNPLFGVGFKNFFKECALEKYKNDKFFYKEHRCTTHPHQLHLDIAVSVGLIGYILLISSFIFIIYLGLKHYVLNPKNNLLLSSIAFIIFSLFLPLPSGSFFTSYGATIFWFNIGLILAFKNKKFINIRSF